MPPIVICTCTSCATTRIIIHGIEQPGQQVSVTTRSKHEKQDKQAANIAKETNTPASKPPSENVEINVNQPNGVSFNCLNRKDNSKYPLNV